MKFKAVIFDKDGLMLETEKLAFEKWTDTMTARGYSVNKEMFLRLLGRNAVEEEKILTEMFGDDFPFLELYNERNDLVEKHIIEHGIDHKKGLLPLLELLDNHQITKAVATSTFRVRGVPVLRSAGLLDRFNMIVFGDDVKKSKPEPDIFLETARRLGVAPSECVVLEDSDAGIQAASSAGMIPIMIPDMKPPEDISKKLAHQIFPSLVEVRTFLSENLNNHH